MIPFSFLGILVMDLSPLLVPLLIVLGLLLFGLCLFNLLVKFVSSRIRSIKLQMNLMHGFQPIHTSNSVTTFAPLIMTVISSSKPLTWFSSWMRQSEFSGAQSGRDRSTSLPTLEAVQKTDLHSFPKDFCCWLEMGNEEAEKELTKASLTEASSHSPGTTLAFVHSPGTAHIQPLAYIFLSKLPYKKEINSQPGNYLPPPPPPLPKKEIRSWPELSSFWHLCRLLEPPSTWLLYSL